eukprot:8046733-Ditylum_brightwellii.AAC.1
MEGPIAWGTQRQSETVQSTCEAEVVATNARCKESMHLCHVCSYLNLNGIKESILLYNNRSACVDCSKNSTTTGIRHINLKENFAHEHHCNCDVNVRHVGGKVNFSNIFTK